MVNSLWLGQEKGQEAEVLYSSLEFKVMLNNDESSL
jgi:hypothetical protein